MRGSPLVRAVIAFLVLLSLGWPLYRLTRGRDAPVVARDTSAESREGEIRLRLTFSTPAKSVKVLHLGKEIWSELAPAPEIERSVKLVFPQEGIDLQFQAEFAADASVALRVRLTDPAGEEREKTLWGKGGIDDALTFP